MFIQFSFSFNKKYDIYGAFCHENDTLHLKYNYESLNKALHFQMHPWPIFSPLILNWLSHHFHFEFVLMPLFSYLNALFYTCIRSSGFVIFISTQIMNENTLLPNIIRMEILNLKVIPDRQLLRWQRSIATAPITSVSTISL